MPEAALHAPGARVAAGPMAPAHTVMPMTAGAPGDVRVAGPGQDLTATMSEQVQALQALFEHIACTRMVGVPLLHPALSVRTVSFAPLAQAQHRPQQGSPTEGREAAPALALGVLVTPWSMNLMLLPLDAAARQSLPAPGAKQLHELGAHRLEFVGAEEPGFGPWAQCSLFSPMQAFADQAAAEGTARAALAELRDPEARPDGRSEADLGTPMRQPEAGPARVAEMAGASLPPSLHSATARAASPAPEQKRERNVAPAGLRTDATDSAAAAGAAAALVPAIASPSTGGPGAGAVPAARPAHAPAPSAPAPARRGFLFGRSAVTRSERP